MVRSDLIAKAENARQLIERTLATSKGGMTLSEIVEATGLSPATVKRHLEKLIAIGRIEVEYHRGSPIYYWNGREEYQEEIRLSENHRLYLDILINRWGKPFIRVKETKRNPITKEYIDMGAILLDERIIDEFIEKLQKLRKNLTRYQ